jgi:DNA-binding IclR family transcriptional regulator
MQDGSTSRYRLGYTLVKLGELAKKCNDLILIAQRHIYDLAQMWGEATVVDVPDQNLHMDSVLIVASTYRLGTTSSYDRPVWPHATAAGKVILAHLSDGLLEKFLSSPLPSYTPFTITAPELLKKELGQVSKQGYAVNYEEQELGLVAVGAPIFDHTQCAIAALSIGGPSARMTGDNFQKIVKSVVDTARIISAELGYES